MGSQLLERALERAAFCCVQDVAPCPRLRWCFDRSIIKSVMLCSRPLRTFWQRRVWVTPLQRGPLRPLSRRLQLQLCLLWGLAAVLQGLQA